VNDWDEFPPRDGILNPGYKLEWERYQQKIVTDFLAWQASIVKEYKRADQFITQNFVGGVRTDIDEFEIARHLDIASVNPYHAVQDELDGESIALSGDLCRSLKQSNYLITETNAQTIGWDSKTQLPPYDGQLRLNVYSHVSSGANMVAYWHWHSLHYGQETYWKGILSHDLEPNRAYREVSRVAHELQALGPKLVNLKKKNKVAILYSVDSHNGIQFMPFHDTVDYMYLLHQFYRTLFRLNIGVDFVFPQSSNFSDYQVIVVPPLYIASDALLERLSSFVAQGGHLLLTLKTGFCDENSMVRPVRAPGPLRKACGFYYQEFSNLKQNLALKGDPFHASDANRVSVWAELIIPESAQGLAFYDHPFFGKYPAVTRNRYERGTVTYVGTVLSDLLQSKVVEDILKCAGLMGPDQELPPAIRVKSGIGAAGKNVRYYLNYSSTAQTFKYPYATGTELLSQKKIERSETVTLPPWDLAIIEEN
jgi:beta-galactosidase